MSTIYLYVCVRTDLNNFTPGCTCILAFPDLEPDRSSCNRLCYYWAARDLDSNNIPACVRNDTWSASRVPAPVSVQHACLARVTRRQRPCPGETYPRRDSRGRYLPLSQNVTTVHDNVNCYNDYHYTFITRTFITRADAGVGTAPENASFSRPRPRSLT